VSKQIKVLIVDDERTVRDVLCRLLEALRYDCVTTQSGQEGMEKLRGDRFDVALVDLVMPGMDGFALLQAMAEADIPTVPVVLSGHGAEADRREAMRLGAFDFLEKPPDPRTLERTITRAVQYATTLRRAHDTEVMARNLQAIFDALPDFIVIVDRDGMIVQLNRAVLDQLGTSKEVVIGQDCHKTLCGNEHPRETCPFREVLPAARAQPPKQPQRLWGRLLHIISSRLQNASDEYWGVMYTARDVTAQVEIETQLRQAQKLESIGQLAAGIAHEINTPTQYVGDNTRFLQDSFADLIRLVRQYRQLVEAVNKEKETGAAELLSQIKQAEREVDLDYLMEEIPRAIEQSLDGVERVTRIVRAMKEFSHPASREKTPVNINKAIQSTITVSRNEWKYVAEMATDFDPTLPLVPAYEADLNQTVLNLIVNAAHAIAGVVGEGSKEKGRIIVSTRQDGEWAEIRIADTGGGIPESIRERLFDPFFTTKEVGKGTGQGLAIARSIVVDKHGGTINFETEIGSGTTFIIRLPISTSPDERSPEDSP